MPACVYHLCCEELLFHKVANAFETSKSIRKEHQWVCSFHGSSKSERKVLDEREAGPHHCLSSKMISEAAVPREPSTCGLVMFA